MASKVAQVAAEKVVTKVLMPAVSISLTKAGTSSDKNRKMIADCTKLFTDQLAVAIDLVLEAQKKGTITSGGVLSAALKKVGATSPFWGSDTADCLANMGLFALSVGETAAAVAADAETLGAATGIVIMDALKLVADYYAMQTACKAPYERAKQDVEDKVNTFGAEFMYQFNQWLQSNGAPALPY